MKAAACIILFITALFSACSDSSVETTLTGTDEDNGNTILEIKNAIGVETGDENLTFGSIESMCETPDGNIALLDRAYSHVKIFSPDGEYLRTIGNQGPGPGEMSMTIYMGISDNGNLFVSQRSGCNEFNYYTGEWITLEVFNGPPPVSITGGPDSVFIATSMEMIETDEGLGIEVNVSRYTDPYTTDISYTGNYFDLNPSDMSIFFQQGWYNYCFDVDVDGNVYVAGSSTDEYKVTCYTALGEEFLTITEAVIPVAKTQEDIEEEKRFYEARFQSLGMGQISYTPLENWNTIRGLGIDGQNRIWVLSGVEATPTFSVYGSSGDKLFTAELPCSTAEGRYWRFSVERDFILAWSDSPEDGYQKFYIIALPE